MQLKKNLNVFVSPRPILASRNIYISQLVSSLSQHVTVLNSEAKKAGRSKDLVQHIFKADLLILNWSEDTLNLRYGLIQSVVFNIGVLIAKMRGCKVLWVCHNRKSHHNKFPLLNRLNRKFFALVANKILVHSEDGKAYLKNKKAFYLPHPRYDKIEGFAKPASLSQKNVDVLIWGAISPYKGLEAFIEQYRKHDQQFRTLIIGKAKPGYANQLLSLAAGTNIKIVNSFVSESDLYALFEESKIVLLPYLHTDTFSSGALIHSINSGKIVIGPEVGNFLDLRDANACLTYPDYVTLFETINALLDHEVLYQKTLAQLKRGMSSYYADNSWERFAGKLLPKLGFDISKPVPPELTVVHNETAADRQKTVS